MPATARSPVPTAVKPAATEIDWSKLGAIQTVPITLIHPNPLNGRTVYDEADLEKLAADMRTAGVREPIKVYRDENGEGLIFGGHRRMKGAERAELENVPIRVVDVSGMTKADLMLAMDADNENRVDLSELEQGHRLKAILAESNGSLTIPELAKKKGLGQATLEKYIGLAELPTELQTALASDKLRLGIAYCLVNQQKQLTERGVLPPADIEKQLLELAVEAMSGRLKAGPNDSLVSTGKAKSSKAKTAKRLPPELAADWSRRTWTDKEAKIEFTVDIPPHLSQIDLVGAAEQLYLHFKAEWEKAKKK